MPGSGLVWTVIEKHKKRITGLTRIFSSLTLLSLTYSGLQEGGHKSSGGLLGAGQDGEGGDQQGQPRVTRHDDGVGRHTARPREPEHRRQVIRNTVSQFTVLVISLIL